MHRSLFPFSSSRKPAVLSTSNRHAPSVLVLSCVVLMRPAEGLKLMSDKAELTTVHSAAFQHLPGCGHVWNFLGLFLFVCLFVERKSCSTEEFQNQPKHKIPGTSSAWIEVVLLVLLRRDLDGASKFSEFTHV